MPELETRIREVKVVPTSGGNSRFVVVDSEGREFTTFREKIGASLEGAEGRRARIRYHEQQRGRFTNVYLDEVELLEDEAGETEREEVAWRTTMEAAPYLLSREAVEQETPPEDLFDKLKPFKDLVAEDLEAEDEGENG